MNLKQKRENEFQRVIQGLKKENVLLAQENVRLKRSFFVRNERVRNIIFGILDELKREFQRDYNHAKLIHGQPGLETISGRLDAIDDFYHKIKDKI